MAPGGVAGTQLDDSSSSACDSAAISAGTWWTDHADGVCRGLSLSSVATKPRSPPIAAAGSSQLDTGVHSPPVGSELGLGLGLGLGRGLVRSGVQMSHNLKSERLNCDVCCSASHRVQLIFHQVHHSRR